MDIEKLNEAYGKAVAVSVGITDNPELETIAHDVVIFLGGLIESHGDTDEQLSNGITG